MINPMGLSTPKDDSIEIIALHPVKTFTGINPMILSDPWYDSINIIALKTLKKN